MNKTNNRSYTVAWVVLVIAIVAGLILGQVRKPGSSYAQFVRDEAGVLNSSVEAQLAEYNKRWDEQYHSMVGFVSMDRVSGDWEDYAYRQAARMGLSDNSALLLVIEDEDGYRFVWGSNFDALMTASTASRLENCLAEGSWQSCVPRFYAELDSIYADYFGDGYASGPAYSGGVTFTWLLWLVVILILLYVVLSAIERARFNAYRTQYYGVVNPPVVFRPVFFWHGARSSWYRRHWAPPRPRAPKPPRPPQPPRSGGFSGSSRGSGFSSGSRSSSGTRRTGGFSGSSRGTGFSGGGSVGRSRGGGFSGGSRGGGMSRGGSFGGSRGGGSRGGSFGGRR